MSVLGVVFIIVGVLLILSAIKTKLIIEKAGTPYVISVPFYEKSKIKEINEFIHKYLKGDTDKTDLNLFFDKKEKQPNESD